MRIALSANVNERTAVSTRISRRGFIQGTGAVAAGAALAGCGNSAGKNSTARNEKVKLPTYQRFEGAKPDLPPTAEGVQPGYLRYPANPQACTDGKPGGGGTVSAMFAIYAAAPPKPPQNKYWANLNDALGVDLKLNMVLAGNMPEKLATTIAGNDIPDIVQLSPYPPNTPQLLEAKFQPLTEYLSGDAIKEYPLLANLTTEQWRTTVFNGEIYGIPIPREKVGGIMYRRDDVFDKLGINKQPASYAEFKEICKQLSDGKHRWAIGNWGSLIGFIQEMLGAPNGWRESGGKFTCELEDPTYKKVLSDIRDLVKEGCVHPDAFNTNAPVKDWFGGGITPLNVDNYNAWTGYLASYKPEYPEMNINAMLPPDYDANTRATIRRGNPSYDTTVLKKAKPARIKELLRIANYLASPFGTKEYIIRRWGVEGIDFTLKNGNVNLTPKGTAEDINSVAYIADAPSPIYEPGHPEEVKKEYDYQLKAVPRTVANPAVDLFSNTSVTQGPALGTLLQQARVDILQGHKPLSHWDDVVKQWRREGGDKMRKEYEEAFAKSQ
jgi:putative aldouronate transport system substrate-binding protein